MSIMEDENAWNRSCCDFHKFALDGFMDVLSTLVKTETPTPDDLGEWEALSIMIAGWSRREGTDGLPDIAMLGSLVAEALAMLDKARSKGDLHVMLRDEPDWPDEEQVRAPLSKTIH